MAHTNNAALGRLGQVCHNIKATGDVYWQPISKEENNWKPRQRGLSDSSILGMSQPLQGMLGSHTSKHSVAFSQARLQLEKGTDDTPVAVNELTALDFGPTASTTVESSRLSLPWLSSLWHRLHMTLRDGFFVLLYNVIFYFKLFTHWCPVARPGP